MSMEKIAEGNIMAVFIFFLIAWFLETLWSAWVLTILWRWFVTPAFGLPQLNVITAIGVMLIVRFVTFNPDSINLRQERDEVEVRLLKLFVAFLNPVVALAVGWVFKAIF